ncbi:MAG: carboxymuconolactone decarboxylase family protein [Dehalococcoidia bacterium]
MSKFNVHTKATVSTESAELLGKAEKAYGFIPNLLGVLAESPAALKAYLTVGQIFDESSFSPTERQVVLLAASRFNEYRYCVAAHSAAAGLQKVPTQVIDAIRNDRPIVDGKLEALRVFTTVVVEKRGWVSEADIAEFLIAGYTRAQVLEVIVGVSFKTLSNYVNHIADTPLDDAFAARAWTPNTERLAS